MKSQTSEIINYRHLWSSESEKAGSSNKAHSRYKWFQSKRNEGPAMENDPITGLINVPGTGYVPGRYNIDSAALICCPCRKLMAACLQAGHVVQTLINSFRFDSWTRTFPSTNTPDYQWGALKQWIVKMARTCRKGTRAFYTHFYFGFVKVKHTPRNNRLLFLQIYNQQ